jgi:Secretion system C-terminal sorting domain/Beta-propeller repeat
MNHTQSFFLMLFLWTSQSALFATNPAPSKWASANQAAQAQFWENKGQIRQIGTDVPAQGVKFAYAHKGLKIFLLENGLAYQFEKLHFPEDYKQDSKTLSPEEYKANNALREKIRLETFRMNMQLIGANPRPRISKSGESTDFINFYNRNALEVRGYQKITYHDIYPSIDWVIYTDNKGGVKYDFVAKAGADISNIKIRFQNHEKAQVNPDGSFSLSNPMGSITEQAPVSFQNGQSIATKFVYKDNILNFVVTNYDKSQDLIIDPNVLWATYYGGTDAEKGFSCALDANENIYLAGSTQSTNDIAASGHQTTSGGFEEAFLVKFNSAGTRLWATYYGGNNDDNAVACVADANGNVYLTGDTRSAGAVASGGHQNVFGGGNYDAFLVKFNSAGTRLWATYYGGTDNDYGKACTVDANGNVYLAGTTLSNGAIASGGHQNTIGSNNFEDAFLVKFNSAGTRLWATYYGGTGSDYGRSCTVDASGNVYLAGYTGSSTAIASGGHQNIYGTTSDAFLAKFNSNGVRQWATYYGGSTLDYGYSCVTDASGNVYLVGYTNSTSAVAGNGHQNALGGGYDAFLVKFNSAGTRLWATYYGGTGGEYGLFCNVDASGNVYLAGYTYSPTNIAANGHQNTYNGASDAFVVKFTTTGTRVWGTYYGGSNSETGYSCAVDASGNVYLVGTTGSLSAISFAGHQNTYGGVSDAFLVKLKDTPCAVINNTIAQTICSNQSFLFNGINLNASGTYLDTLIAANGCDSFLTLNLSVTSIDTFVSQQGNTLTARQTGATYQWVQCPATPIMGANSATFTPTVSGNYAVSVTFNGCSLLSGCRSITVTPTSVENIDNQANINIYPNPNTGEFFVAHGLDFAHLRVSDLLGRIIHTQILQQENTSTIKMISAAEGFYIVSILDKNNQQVAQFKILVRP